MFLGYVRVSTREQTQGTSPAEQERIVRGIAMTLGVNEFDTALYSDLGVSGSIPIKNRPGGSRLMADVKPGDTVVAAKLDRMFRDAIDAQETYRDFKAAKIDLILYDLGPDPVTKSGGLSKVFFQIVSVFADAERDRINSRMWDGRKAKAAAGGHVGGMAPYGWKVVGHGKDARLIPVDAEQEVVRETLRLKKEYYGPHAIACHLNGMGKATRTGRPFHRQQVKRIMEQERVAV